MAKFEIIRYGSFNQKSVLSFRDEAKALEEYSYDSRNANRGRIEKVELVKDGQVIRFTLENGEDTEVVEEKVEEAVEEQVAVESEEAQVVEDVAKVEPTLVTVYIQRQKGWEPKAWVKALEPGRDWIGGSDRPFTLESDAWEWAMDKYPSRRIVKFEDISLELKRRAGGDLRNLDVMKR